MKSLAVLGSTGSIGVQALDIAKAHNINIRALTANTNIKLLAQQAREFQPACVAIADESLYANLKQSLADTNIKVTSGKTAIAELAGENDADIVLNAIVGIAGLEPTLAALSAKKQLALANKESLVAGGTLVMQEAKKANITVIPVDSEHSAIFQCLQGNKRSQLSKIILTCSGGPFFGYNSKQLKDVTESQVLAHPNWDMGGKITVDSATLMNKGLELIEAMWLFDLSVSEIDIVIHRQSIIHSLVEYNDYSVIGQLGMPDMRIPIQYAITYPDRFPCPTKRLSLTDIGALTFNKPDYDSFPCLSAAIKAAEFGGAMPCMVSGANEQAVELFLSGKLKFHQIGELVSQAVCELKNQTINSISDVLYADNLAREYILGKLG